MEPSSPLFPTAPKRHRIHRGLTERQEHIFTWMAVVVVLLYATLWVQAITEVWRARDTPVDVADGEHTEPVEPPPTPVQSLSTFGPQLPKTTYLCDSLLGFLHPLRGISGELRYAPVLPGSRVV